MLPERACSTSIGANDPHVFHPLMFCVPALAVIAAAIDRSVSRSTPRCARPESKDRPKVLVVGYGRVGKLVAELLTKTPSPGHGPSRYLAWKGSNTCSVGELPRPPLMRVET
jgi:hypothetical protein